MILSSESVDEILDGVTIQMKPLQQYVHKVLFKFKYLQNEIWDSS